uniref:Inositol polyphosphate-related phosphatase domain-containing protein n=1 Tax=Glossina morsitans morsitans TaxID=37546 RepID=A0A1B0FC32_GLOMM
MDGDIVAQLCIYILTWNVGGHYPDDISLNDALSLNGTVCPNNSDVPDIYVIGFQEVNTQPKNQIMNYFQDDQWTFKVKEHLDDMGFIKVGAERLQGMLINMWVQPKHISHIRQIETQNTKTGFGGLWGNKGAVSIRLSLYGTGVVFVASHLAAHDEKLRERVEDYDQIVDNHHYKAPKYRNIFDHNFVFWFGDLNFRLDSHDSVWDIRNAVEQGRLDELYQLDQLKLVRETGNAFSLMEERKPNFPPTFKFIEGTSDYNLKRRPAWCDRILYRLQAPDYPDVQLNVQQLSYKSHPEYTLSDHKPVSAEFLITIKADKYTDDELYEMTHGGSIISLPLVRLIFISFYLTMF